MYGFFEPERANQLVTRIQFQTAGIKHLSSHLDMRKITTYARENRKKPTKAEAELRRKLLKWKIRFRSQRQFDFFIVDFLIPEKRLAIEVDGGYHVTRTAYDNRRTKYLESLGLTIARVSNETVLTTDCSELKQLIVSLPTHDISALPLRLSYGVAKY